MKRYLITGMSFLLLTACLEGNEPDETGPIDYTVNLDKPENGYQLKSEPYIVPAGSETYTCDVIRIDPQDDETYAWINSLHSLTSESSHHMNVNLGLFSVMDLVGSEGMAESILGVELGQYDCDELGDLMADQQLQTLYPSQRREQFGNLPEGVALPLPVPLVVVMNHHYINPHDRPVKVNAVLNLTATEEENVEHVATGFTGGIQDISVPPHSRKIEARTCKLDIEGTLNVFAISSHSHEKAGCFSMNLYSDAEGEGIEPDPFFVNKDWESPPIMFFEQEEWTGNQTLPMKAGDGIHWGCHYYNDESRTVERGAKSSDEMCIFVAMGYPSRHSVEDIKKAFESPAEGIMDSLLEVVPCKSVEEEPESPWDEVDNKANVTYALEEGDGPWDACHGYPQTE